MTTTIDDARIIVSIPGYAQEAFIVEFKGSLAHCGALVAIAARNLLEGKFSPNGEDVDIGQLLDWFDHAPNWNVDFEPERDWLVDRGYDYEIYVSHNRDGSKSLEIGYGSTYLNTESYVYYTVENFISMVNRARRVFNSRVSLPSIDTEKKRLLRQPRV